MLVPANSGPKSMERISGGSILYGGRVTFASSFGAKPGPIGLAGMTVGPITISGVIVAPFSVRGWLSVGVSLSLSPGTVNGGPLLAGGKRSPVGESDTLLAASFVGLPCQLPTTI